MKKLVSLSFVAPLAIGVAVAAAVSAPAPRAEAQIIVAAPVLRLDGKFVSLTCKNPGSSQDVAKTPVLVNTTSAAIPKGQTISWKASDGDQGTYKLGADLAPGASLKVMGKAGQAYTCSAQFFASPDLKVQQRSWNATTGLAVKVANLDGHVGAPASTVRVEVRACTGVLLSSGEAQASSIGAGGAATVTVPVKAPTTKYYLRITADAKKAVSESNEANNVWDEYSSCIK